MARVTVLGFDAFDPSFTKYTTTLSSMKLVKLDSIIPVTWSSWTSIMSGVNPGKHCLLGFFKIEKREGRWVKEMYSSDDLGYPRIHEILSIPPNRDKIRFFITNPVPPSVHVSVPNGSVVNVVDFFGDDYSTNPFLFNRLYHLDVFSERIERELFLGNPKRIAEYEEPRIREHHEVLKEVINDYDLVWYNLHVPDRDLHLYPDIVTKNNPSHLTRVFQLLDDMVRTAIENSDHVIVVSDHGFGSFHGFLRVNKLLIENGLAKQTTDPSRTIGLGEDVKVIGNPVARMIAKIGIVRRIGRRIIRKTGRRITLGFIDVYGSDAFYPPITDIPEYHFIHFNDPSKRPIVKKLLEETGGVQVYYPEEQLTGPCTPIDRLLIIQDKLYPVSSIIGDVVEEGLHGDHKRHGVFIYKGDGLDLENVKELKGHNVTQIVLSLLELPLGKEMDDTDTTNKITGKKNDKVEYKRLFQVTKKIRTKPIRNPDKPRI